MVEAWNSKINRTINKNNVSLTRLLNALLNDAACSNFKKMQFELNVSTGRLALHQRKDEFVLHTQMELINHLISIGIFLKKFKITLF